MTAFTHRDLTVQRAISRAFVTVGMAVLALCVLAMLAPEALLGALGVTALGACGLGYVLWSERLLGEYVRGLREVREGFAPEGSLPAETGSSVSLDQPRERPTQRFPSTRPRR
jgi:hypothetical protein